MAGVDITGFTGKTIEEINAEIRADQLTTISSSLNQSPNQPLGQINGIVSKKAAEIWEALQVAYNAFNRDAAEGILLDNVGAITGTTRKPATRSEAPCTVNLGVSFSQPAGVMIVNVAGQPNIKFRNKNTVTSTSAGNYTAIFECLDYGPVTANAGTLTAITPVTGWNSCTNPLDAAKGRNIETDAEYRISQRDELSASGSGTLDAMRADLLRLASVLECTVFENVTDVTDVDGLPAHQIEAVIFDSPTVSNDIIAQVIWNNKPSGIGTHGLVSGNAIDSTGATRIVYFSRPTVRQVYIDAVFQTSDSGVAVETLVKNTISNQALAVQKLGVDVVVAKYVGAVVLGVAPIIDVSSFKLGFAPSPTGTVNLVIGSREVAHLDTANMTIGFV